MSDARLQLDAREWRARADELFHRAETMHDDDARQKIREIAASYESLAKRVEQGPDR
jgi:hypothetical protein